MKTIGLIGGMSWESTQIYYRELNQEVKRRLGGLHSAKIILNSLDFAEIEKCQSSGDWQKATMILSNAAKALENAGADILALCTNTMHKVSDKSFEEISIPFLHIAKPTALAAHQKGHKTIGLMGTRFTMEESFYKDQLKEQGLVCVVPSQDARNEINRIIYEELCLGKIENNSKVKFKNFISDLEQSGATAIVLGCTELGMLTETININTELLDTTFLHVRALADFALEYK